MIIPSKLSMDLPKPSIVKNIDNFRLSPNTRQRGPCPQSGQNRGITTLQSTLLLQGYKLKLRINGHIFTNFQEMLEAEVVNKVYKFILDLNHRTRANNLNGLCSSKKIQHAPQDGPYFEKVRIFISSPPEICALMHKRTFPKFQLPKLTLTCACKLHKLSAAFQCDALLSIVAQYAVLLQARCSAQALGLCNSSNPLISFTFVFMFIKNE